MIQRFLLIFSTIMLLTACGGGKSKITQTESSEARLLTISQKQGYAQVEIKDPWQGGKVLHTYLLVPRDSVMPANMPAGTVVRTPIQHALVYSEVHTGLMRELGSITAVKGVCDSRYFTDPQVIKLINEGEITDCGNSMSPTIEKVIE